MFQEEMSEELACEHKNQHEGPSRPRVFQGESVGLAWERRSKGQHEDRAAWSHDISVLRLWEGRAKDGGDKDAWH